MKPLNNFIMERYIRMKEPKDYVQLRLVILDEYDRVVKVVYTSDEFPPQDRFGKDVIQANVDIVLDRVKPHHNYDFNDYDNIPFMEIQARRKDSDEWVKFSDPVEDYYNM